MGDTARLDVPQAAESLPGPTTVDPMALHSALELVDAAYEEAMRKHGLFRGTRSQITAHARLHVITALAARFREHTGSQEPSSGGLALDQEGEMPKAALRY